MSATPKSIDGLLLLDRPDPATEITCKALSGSLAVEYDPSCEDLEAMVMERKAGRLFFGKKDPELCNQALKLHEKGLVELVLVEFADLDHGIFPSDLVLQVLICNLELLRLRDLRKRTTFLAKQDFSSIQPTAYENSLPVSFLRSRPSFFLTFGRLLANRNASSLLEFCEEIEREGNLSDHELKLAVLQTLRFVDLHKELAGVLADFVQNFFFDSERSTGLQAVLELMSLVFADLGDASFSVQAFTDSFLRLACKFDHEGKHGELCSRIALRSKSNLFILVSLATIYENERLLHSFSTDRKNAETPLEKVYFETMLKVEDACSKEGVRNQYSQNELARAYFDYLNFRSDASKPKETHPSFELFLGQA